MNQLHVFEGTISGIMGGTETNCTESVVVWGTYMWLKVLSRQWSGGQRQIAMNQYIVGWSSYTYLKVVSQQQLRQSETNCNESGSYEIQQLCMFEGTITAIIGKGLRQMAAKKPE